MSKTFIYLVPSKHSSYYKTRNEYFIIEELKKLGHVVHIVSGFYAFRIKQLQKLCSIDGIIFNSLKLIFRRKTILDWSRNKKIPVYWWYFDTATVNAKRQQRVIEVAKMVTTFFNKDKSMFSRYIDEGISPVWLDQGVPHLCEMVVAKEHQYDLGFFGSFHVVHQNRTSLLKLLDDKYSLIIYTSDVDKFKTAGFKNVRPAVDQKGIGTVVSEIKIVLVLNFSNLLPYYWSDRIHLMIGSGAFCIAEKIEGIETIYTDNEDVILFDGEQDLITKIDKSLSPDKDKERESIRKTGYAKAHQLNSYNNRVIQFCDNLPSA